MSMPVDRAGAAGGPGPADILFTGSVPQFYDEHLVPLIFAPYAADLARRVAGREPSNILEIAAGTGAVTRELARALPDDVPIIASDLNLPMLAQAQAVGASRAIEWRQADAMALPFPDRSFDLVVCQFGAMFFPDKAKAFAEARRVLRPRGALIFNVWDRIADNEFADTVTNALAAMFPADPPRFLARLPHGYHDTETIAHDLARGGFGQPPSIVTVTKRSRASSPQVPAMAYCQGTPLRGEIEARGPARLAEATDRAAAAMAQRFGDGPVDGRIQAHVVSVEP